MKPLFTALLLCSSVFASDCTDASNFPSTLSIGDIYPIIQISQLSPDGTLNTTIAGSILVLSPCSLQFKNLVLFSAPPSAQIQVYSKQGLKSFPVSAQTLSGIYANQDGPIITFSDTSVFQIPGSPGVSWKDIDELVIFSTSQSWVIAKIELPVLLVQSVATSGAMTTIQDLAPSVTVVNAQIPSVRPFSYPKVNSGSVFLGLMGISYLFIGTLVSLILL